MNNQNRQIGDIFYSSWGYGQTNVDFFQVIELVGKKSVLLKEIKAIITDNHSEHSGKVKPLKDEFFSEEIIKKRISKDNDIKIDAVRYARKFTDESDSIYSSWNCH